MQQLECETYSITCMSCLYVHVYGNKVIYLSIYLHAFSGADTVAKFNQLGKVTWLKIFMKSGSDKIGALEPTLIVNETSAQRLAMLALFECDAYCTKGIEIKANI